MLDQLTPYGIGVTVPLPYREAVRATRAALDAAGFGVLTEIDFAAVLGARLGVELPPYLVLGACHAPSAHGVASLLRQALAHAEASATRAPEARDALVPTPRDNPGLGTVDATEAIC